LGSRPVDYYIFRIKFHIGIFFLKRQVRVSRRHPGDDGHREDPARVAGDPAGRGLQGQDGRAHLQKSRLRIPRSGQQIKCFNWMKLFDSKIYVMFVPDPARCTV
jgi:hypothetical protein